MYRFSNQITILLFITFYLINFVYCGKEKGGHKIIVTSGGKKCDEITKYVPVPIPVPTYRHGRSHGHFASSSASFQSLGSFPPRVWSHPYLSLKKLAKKGRKKIQGPQVNQGKWGEKVKKSKKGQQKAAASSTNFYAIPVERRIQLVPQLTNYQLPNLPHSFIPNIIGNAINQNNLNPFLPRSPLYSPPIIPTIPRSVMVPRIDFRPFSNPPFPAQVTPGLSPARQPETKYWWDKDLNIDDWNNKQWIKESERRWDKLLATEDDKLWASTEEKWPQPEIHSYGNNKDTFDLLHSDDFPPSFIRK